MTAIKHNSIHNNTEHFYYKFRPTTKTVFSTLSSTASRYWRYTTLTYTLILNIKYKTLSITFWVYQNYVIVSTMCKQVDV